MAVGVGAAEEAAVGDEMRVGGMVRIAGSVIVEAGATARLLNDAIELSSNKAPHTASPTVMKIPVRRDMCAIVAYD